MKTIHKRLFGNKPINYILRELFTTNKAAPLGSTRLCEPGPGSLTITDTNSIMSIVDGKLTINGTPAGADKVVAATLARLCGRSMFFSWPTHTAPTTGGNPRIGLTATVNGTEDIGIDAATATSFRIKTAASVIETITFSSGLWEFVLVMRGTGGYVFGRDNTTGPYTLLWVYNSVTSDLIPNIYLNNATSLNLAIDDIRILDLPSPFDTDYGIATFRDTSFAAGTTRPGLINFVLEINIALSGSPTFAMKFRRQDTNNAWIFQITGTSGRLDEYNAGALTNRAVHNAGYGDGTYRILLTIDGQSMRIYRNNVLSMSYTDTNNKFPGMSDIEYTTIGAGVTLTDIVMYPRLITFPAV